MENSKLSETLKYLMFKKNIRTAELARQVNLPQQTLQRITSGLTPKPHLSSLIPLAEYFSITVDQLRGIDPIPGLTDPVTSRVTEIALIPWKEVTNRLLMDDKEKYQCQRTVVDIPVGPRAYALVMDDSSMEPLFPEQTLLIIDPDRDVKDRQYVIAKLKDQPNVIFRQLLIDSRNRYIKATSPEFSQSAMIKLSEEDAICGALVQARRNYID